MNSDIFFFAIPDKSHSDEISSFNAELSDSEDRKFFTDSSSEATFTYAYIRKSDSIICGFVQYRPDSSFVPGNIGYLIRPSLRGIGMGKKMLYDFLSFIKIFSIPFLFVSCLESNIPSVKTALACGGTEIFPDEIPSGIRVFCFSISDSYIFHSDAGEILIESAPGIFSPKGPDPGTLAMLSFVSFDGTEKILDLGCGTGIVGIYAGKRLANLTDSAEEINLLPEIYQSDILPEAVEISRKNALLNGIKTTVIESSGFDSIDVFGFDLILSNPPYHTDFSVAKNFIEKGFRHLKTGGTMVMVTKRLDWYKNKLTSVFGGVKVREKDGYFIFIAEKRPKKPKQ